MIYHNEDYSEEFIQLRTEYRKCFSQYPNVLAHILADCGTFCEISDDARSVALKNFGTRIMDIIGVNDEDIITDVMRLYLKLPLAPNKPQEENRG